MIADEGGRDPGSPSADDEEALDAELVEEASVAPGAETVPGLDTTSSGADSSGAGSVDGAVSGAAVVNDGTAGGDGIEAPYEEELPVDGEAGTDTAPDLHRELAERTEDLQRVTAEFTNYRRRAERDRTAGAAEARARVLAELIPVVDDLERARAHGDLDQGPLKVFADKMAALLDSQGVEEFGAEGDAFDPSVHEAVQDESTGGAPVVGTVLRKGYRLADRTLRTAMVIVR